MNGPLLFFADHMLLMLGVGLVIGLVLIGAAVRVLRRPPTSAGRRRLWGAAALGVAGFGLAVGTIFVFSQVGPTLVDQSSLVGRSAPPLEVSRLEDGRTVSLADFEGQVVLVNFWATWCPPCREEMRDLDRLQKELRDRGVVVLNVSDESPETITSYLEARPMSTVHGYAQPLPWPEFGRPTSFIVDRTGVLRRVVQGPRTFRQFHRLVSRWL